MGMEDAAPSSFMPGTHQPSWAMEPPGQAGHGAGLTFGTDGEGGVPQALG